MSTMKQMSDELAAIQKAYGPIRSEMMETTPGTKRCEELEEATGAFVPLERAAVSALSRMEPTDAREALALALVTLDYAVLNGNDMGGPDGTGSQRAAARGLVAYLARQAGLLPEDLGIFADALEESREMRWPVSPSLIHGDRSRAVA